MQRAGRHYAMICECSDCFERYWFHMPDVSIPGYLESYQEGDFEKAKPEK